jgi:hypothetical protein
MSENQEFFERKKKRYRRVYKRDVPMRETKFRRSE